MRLRRNALVFWWIFGAVLLVSGRGLSQTLTADEIVDRMMEKNAERRAELQHYVSERTYKLTYSGTGGEHHAEMVVHAEYAAPGRKQLTIMSESGSKVLCAEVLRKLVEGEQETAEKQDWARTMFSPETYTLQLLGEDQVEGIEAWVLHVEPKASTRVGYRGKLWVSKDDYAMVRLQAEPVKSPSWFVSHPSFDAWYMRRGEVWVPEKNISTTHVRIGGDAKVTIDYGQYAVLSTIPMSTPGVLADGTPQRGMVGKKVAGNSLR